MLPAIICEITERTTLKMKLMRIALCLSSLLFCSSCLADAVDTVVDATTGTAEAIGKSIGNTFNSIRVSFYLNNSMLL